MARNLLPDCPYYSSNDVFDPAVVQAMQLHKYWVCCKNVERNDTCNFCHWVVFIDANQSLLAINAI